MNKKKLAACGIDCTECGSYKVTMEQDLNAAEHLVEWYRSMGWIEENEGAESVIKKIRCVKAAGIIPMTAFLSMVVESLYVVRKSK